MTILEEFSHKKTQKFKTLKTLYLHDHNEFTPNYKEMKKPNILRLINDVCLFCWLAGWLVGWFVRNDKMVEKKDMHASSNSP